MIRAGGSKIDEKSFVRLTALVEGQLKSAAWENFKETFQELGDKVTRKMFVDYAELMMKGEEEKAGT